jgi:hypothetical protein
MMNPVTGGDLEQNMFLRIEILKVTREVRDILTR